MEQQSVVDWLIDQYRKDGFFKQGIYEQAKQMEAEKTYETKAFWYGRGIHAGRNNMIEELKPVKQ